MPSLVVGIEAQFAKFEESLNDLNQKTEDVVGGMSDGFGKIDAKISGAVAGVVALGVALGAMYVASKTFDGLQNYVDDLTELDQTAASLGLRASELSALQLGLRDMGTEADTTDRALQNMLKSLTKAREGGNTRQTAAYGFLGIDPDTIESTEQNLRALADRFAALPDSAQRSAAALAIFGDDWRSMLGSLEQGNSQLDASINKYERLGLVVDDATVEDAKRFANALDEIGVALRGFANEYLAGILEKIMQSLRTMSVLGQTGFDLDLLFLALSTGPEKLGEELNLAADQLARAQRQADAFIEKYNALDKSVIDAATNFQSGKPTLEGMRAQGVVGDIQNDIEAATQEVYKANQKVVALKAILKLEQDRIDQSSIKGFTPPGQLGGAPGGSDSGSTTVKLTEGEKYLAMLTRQTEAVEKLSAVEKLNAAIARGLTFDSKAQQDEITGMARLVDITKELNVQKREQATEDAANERAAEREALRLERLTASYKALINPMEKYIKKVEEIEDLRRRNERDPDTGLSEREALEALKKLNQDSGGDGDAVSDQVDQMAAAARRARDEFDQLAQTVTDMFDDAIFGAGSFSEAIDNLIIQLGRMALQAAGNTTSSVLQDIIFNGGQGSADGTIPRTGGDAPIIDNSGNYQPVGASSLAVGKSSTGAVTYNTYNIPAGVSMTDVEIAVSKGAQYTKDSIQADRASGGAFA